MSRRLATLVPSSALALLLALAAGSALAADPLPLLVCAPGGPGSTADAKSRLAEFSRAFEARTGLAVDAEYHTSQSACDAFWKARAPKLAIFPYQEFFRRQGPDKLLPVAEVIRRGQGDNRYTLVAAKGATLESLAGKTLQSAHLSQSDFLSKVAFEGRVDLAAGFRAEPVASAIRAIKALHKGKADLILLDAIEFASLSELPFAADFEAVATSRPLPGAPLVVVGGDEALAERVRSQIAGLCAKEPAACEALEVEAIRPADASTYAPLAAKR